LIASETGVFQLLLPLTFHPTGATSVSRRELTSSSVIFQLTVTLNEAPGQSTPGGKSLVGAVTLAAKAIFVRGCKSIGAGARSKINERTTRNEKKLHVFIDDLPYS
jgi:hypothetical protein